MTDSARAAYSTRAVSYQLDLNIVGVGIGKKIKSGQATGTDAVRVYVNRKFPKDKIKVRCEPISALIRAAVSETIHAELMAEFEDVFPEIVPETLPPQRKISHHIAIKDKQVIKTLPTYTVPERYMSLLNN